jgi:hypothetical protein
MHMMKCAIIAGYDKIRSYLLYCVF